MAVRRPGRPLSSCPHLPSARCDCNRPTPRITGQVNLPSSGDYSSLGSSDAAPAATYAASAYPTTTTTTTILPSQSPNLYGSPSESLLSSPSHLSAGNDTLDPIFPEFTTFSSSLGGGNADHARDDFSTRTWTFDHHHNHHHHHSLQSSSSYVIPSPSPYGHPEPESESGHAHATTSGLSLLYHRSLDESDEHHYSYPRVHGHGAAGNSSSEWWASATEQEHPTSTYSHQDDDDQSHHGESGGLFHANALFLSSSPGSLHDHGHDHGHGGMETGTDMDDTVGEDFSREGPGGFLR